MLYDVHCHIQETPASYGVIKSQDNIRYCVQATNYVDWKDVVELKRRFGDKVIPAFGIHPWFVEKIESGDIPPYWKDDLRRLIKEHGGIVGECGLDKVARNRESNQVYPFEPQIGLLKEHLRLACELNVPVSLHCVRAFGALADVLRDGQERKTLPPHIMLHSYSGSADMLRQMFCRGELGGRIYVSFSQFVNGRNVEKSKQCIQAVPEDRILVESDLHDAAAASEALDSVIGLVSQARGWSADEARERLADNSRRFFLRHGQS
ncbi:Cut9-interacting protein scn1 [Coemansia interrupta]|uniref:Cut9-interacting protein scn1 n=1 Tax=Coemansia interrupta TaxID=1126814 RepID=A0A9W8HAY0_9FUNG|nr:Cut9-interacting protein scn1 [Coemansia interrupta]